METTLANPKPKRRWMQFSLRGLLVMLLMLGAAFGAFGNALHRAWRQRQIVEAIKSLDGGYLYENQGACERPPGPKWLMALVGPDLLLNVACVRLPYASDADLSTLHGLGRLRYLSLSGASVTDAGLEKLDEFAQLDTLDLSGTKVTDAGLVHLQGLPKLTSLDLKGTPVTDAGAQGLLKALPQCRIER